MEDFGTDSARTVSMVESLEEQG